MSFSRVSGNIVQRFQGGKQSLAHALAPFIDLGLTLLESLAGSVVVISDVERRQDGGINIVSGLKLRRHLSHSTVDILGKGLDSFRFLFSAYVIAASIDINGGHGTGVSCEV